MAHSFQVILKQFSGTVARCLLLLALLESTGLAATNAPSPPKPATFKVSGYGLLGNRELKRMLKSVELADKRPQFLDPDTIEDSALLLSARVKSDGFLRPSITVRLRLADGRRMEVKASDLIDHPLPRPLRITRAHFLIHKGLLFYYKELEFTGLTLVPPKNARSYFLETETLLHLKHGKIYTPERLRRGMFGLEDLLDQQGYREAKVQAASIQQDDSTGAVRVRVNVEQGRQFIVHSVREEFFSQGSSTPEQTRTDYPNKPYSKLWVQDFVLGLKTNQYHLGFPDTKVDIQQLHSESQGKREQVDLLARIHSGPGVRIGSVLFQGEKKTSRSLLTRRVRIQHGDLLDPIRVEMGRYRLAKLGVFDTVDLDYEPVDEQTRNVVYKLKEAKTLDLSLLFGWGSYDLLMGGVEADLNNLWGLAHQVKITAVQSFKSTSGNLTYTIPELVGKDIDLFFNGSGLRREEIDFTRLEYGGGVGLHKYFQSAATDFSIRYNYQILNAQDFSTFEAVASEGLTNPAVGSIIFEIKHDRRDNPLNPRTGYKIFATIETGTEYLGGDANYERIEIAPSWHHPLGGGRYISLGLSQGVDVSFGSPANNLPFNKRFFPGGDNSIRGYKEGEASPKDPSGQILGAETYTLATVELEQALTPKWSIVVFSDSLGFAQRIDHYPFDTGLFSVGVGLRWRTLIGPIRLEYGYNLNPRPSDPSGTLQFSLGYPF
jgi:outer membrane protein assembly complex protein YaeT